MTPFVKNPAPTLPEYTPTPDQEKSLAATKVFMQKFVGKITYFLDLENGGKIDPVDELSLRDLNEIDDFFKNFPNVSTSFESEILHTRIHISIETIGVLKPLLLLRIFGKFVDMFEKFPSAYALQGIIQCSERYNILEGNVLISPEALTKKKKQLLDFEIQGQNEAIADGIYSDKNTMNKKQERLKGLKNERAKLGE